MFHTNVFRTDSHPDLQIAERGRYENKINMLSSDLSKSCSPEQLEKAEAIAEKFRESLVFKYISAKNSIVNAVVWKTHCKSYETKISFEINGKQLSISIPAERILRGHPRNIIEEIQQAICQAVARELTQHVFVEVIETTLSPNPKGEHNVHGKRL